MHPRSPQERHLLPGQTPRCSRARVHALTLALCAGLFALAAHTSLGQTAPAPAQPDSDIIELSLFEVRADPRDGYAASNSLTATGFNRSLQKTPMMINVITDEFIRDAGIGSYSQLADYLPNTFVDDDPYALGSTGYARGHATSYYTKDGNRFYTEPILRSGQRVEVIKGPATLFFGRAQPGGIYSFGSSPPSPMRKQSVTLSYGSWDRKNVDLTSQGTLLRNREKRPLVWYRADYNWQEADTFIDFGRDNFHQATGKLGIKPWSKLLIKLSYEYSYRDQAGNARTTPVMNPLWYSDYAAPRAEQLAWARTQSKSNTTDAVSTLWLQNRWRESDNNWAKDTTSAFGLLEQPARRIALDYGLTQYGWSYNASGSDSYARKHVYNWGGDATLTLNPNVSFRLNWYKYDLQRQRLDTSMTVLHADLRLRSSINQAMDVNDSSTMKADALFNYRFLGAGHTTNLAYTWYKDYYTRWNSTQWPVKGAPGVVSDTRTNNTPGWDPMNEEYVRIAPYLRYFAQDTIPTFQDRNYENALSGSHIVEMLDGKLGILLGGRMQDYENKRTRYDSNAKVYTIGATYNITSELVLFASRSTSYEPSINSYYVEGKGTTLDEQISLPAPPRQGVGLDIGLKFAAFDNKINGSISYFDTSRRNDYRTRDEDRTNDDPRNLDTNPDNNVDWYSFGGERLSRGLDLQLTFQPTRNYSVLTTFGWLPTAKIVSNPSLPLITDANGNRIPDPNADNQPGMRSLNAPEWKAAFWNRYQFHSGRLKGLGMGAGLTYSSSTKVTATPNQPIEAPGFTTVRLAFDYAFRAHRMDFRTNLVVSNLFDKKFYRGYNRGEPRAVSLSLTTTY